MPTERRSWPRRLCDLPTLFRVAGGPYVFWNARCIDLSSGGLGLLCGFRFPPGTALVIDLTGPAPVLPARLVHCTARGRDWLLGCAFEAPLTDERLQALLADRRGESDSP